MLLLFKQETWIILYFNFNNYNYVTQMRRQSTTPVLHLVDGAIFAKGNYHLVDKSPY